MTGSLTTDPAVLAKEAANFERISAELKNVVARVESTASQLANHWQGTAAAAAQRVLEQYRQAASQHVGLLNDVSTNVYSAGVRYSATDEEQARRLASKMNVDGDEKEHSGNQLVGYKTGPGGGPPLSEARRRAVEYADKWAGGPDDPHKHNPDYADFGGGGGDCTNFASQVMRAGGFKDVGNGLDDWHRGDINDWYYNNGGVFHHFPGNDRSNTPGQSRKTTMISSLSSLGEARS